MKIRKEKMELLKDGLVEVKEEFFTKDGTYYTILGRKTAGLDRWSL